VVGRTAYRMVREGLTNARKHAPGSRVLVEVSYGESEVAVAVTNSPAPGGPASAGAGLAGTGSGLGLDHLRQRVELIHGTLAAGPTPDDGFRLEARLPAYVPTSEPASRS
jgi:signal transduction histidine kinase